jgi:hypothetical protein
MRTIRKARFPYAQSLSSEVSPEAEGVPNRKALRTVYDHSGGLAPTASGANSVASALSNPAKRDPGRAVRTYHGVRKPNLKTGTFYLAEDRNFLFGSDTLELSN